MSSQFLLERTRAGLRSIVDFAEREADRLIFVFIALYTIVFSGFTIFMYFGFKTYAWDLGIFTQSFWTTINLGKPLHYTLETYVNPSQNFLGAHFSPILFLIVPIYALFQSPMTLLVLQSFLVGLAALPLYWIAKGKLNSKLWGLTFAASFLLNPAVQGMNTFDFHVEALIPLFFLFAFYYLDKGQWIKGTIFCLLTLATIEFAPALIIFLGLYFLFKKSLWAPAINMKLRLKRISVPLALILLSIAWFFLAFNVIYAINPIKTTGLPGNWDNWGTSLGEVVLNVITNPLRALETMVNPIEKVYYFVLIGAPVVFMPLLAPLELVLVLPWALAASLSQYSPYFQPYFQYFGFMAAQIYIAAVFGAKRLFKTDANPQRNLAIEKKLMAIILIVSFVLAIAVSPIGLPVLTSRPVVIDAHTIALEEVIGLVPLNASVATQNDIEPHLAQRENVFVLTWPLAMDFDYILLDLSSSQILYAPPLVKFSPIQALHEILDEGQYGIIAYADGVLLLKKGYSGQYVLYQPLQRVFNYQDLTVVESNAAEVFDESSQSGNVILHSPTDDVGLMSYGPYAWFYNGNYNVTFRLKELSTVQNVVVDVFASSWNFTTNVWSDTTVTNKTLSSGDFQFLGKWQEFTLNFKTQGLKRLEFREFCWTNNSSLSLDNVKVIQLAE